MEFSRIQKYAEAVGWKVEKKIGAASQLYYWVAEPGRHPYTITSIRETLAAKYRELAEQAQRAFETHMKLKYPNQNAAIKQEINQSHYLRSIADSLSEPEEPTMLERLEDAKRKCSQLDTEFVILDALIALYKAKE